MRFSFFLFILCVGIIANTDMTFAQPADSVSAKKKQDECRRDSATGGSTTHVSGVTAGVANTSTDCIVPTGENETCTFTDPRDGATKPCLTRRELDEAMRNEYIRGFRECRAGQDPSLGGVALIERCGPSGTSARDRLFESHPPILLQPFPPEYNPLPPPPAPDPGNPFNDPPWWTNRYQRASVPSPADQLTTLSATQPDAMPKDSFFSRFFSLPGGDSGYMFSQRVTELPTPSPSVVQGPAFSVSGFTSGFGTPRESGSWFSNFFLNLFR
ncbi:MAG: hypothetical protein AAB421_05480 [Patescibacteria group bacterium]